MGLGLQALNPWLMTQVRLLHAGSGALLPAAASNPSVYARPPEVSRSTSLNRLTDSAPSSSASSFRCAVESSSHRALVSNCRAVSCSTANHVESFHDNTSARCVSRQAGVSSNVVDHPISGSSSSSSSTDVVASAAVAEAESRELVHPAPDGALGCMMTDVGAASSSAPTVGVNESMTDDDASASMHEFPPVSSAEAATVAVASSTRLPLPTLITHAFFILLQLPQLRVVDSTLCHELFISLAAAPSTIQDKFVEFACSLPSAVVRSELTRWVNAVRACISHLRTRHVQVDFFRGCVCSLALFHRVNEALKLSYLKSTVQSPAMDRTMFWIPDLTDLYCDCSILSDIIVRQNEAAGKQGDQPSQKRPRLEGMDQPYVTMEGLRFALTSFTFMFDAPSLHRILLVELRSKSSQEVPFVYSTSKFVEN
jgi:hypothetical protein